MSKKRKTSNFWLGALSILFLGLAFFGLLGAFEISDSGNKAYEIFTILLGTMAWTGPFLSFAIALAIWMYLTSAGTQRAQTLPRRDSDKSSKENSSRHSNKVKKLNNLNGKKSGISLPSGKLVSLKGFDEYFSSGDWAEVANAPCEDMAELGKDFSTYFGEGEKFLVRKPSRLKGLQGLKSYFAEVEQEFAQSGSRKNAVKLEVEKGASEKPKSEFALGDILVLQDRFKENPYGYSRRASDGDAVAMEMQVEPENAAELENLLGKEVAAAEEGLVEETVEDNDVGYPVVEAIPIFAANPGVAIPSSNNTAIVNQGLGALLQQPGVRPRNWALPPEQLLDPLPKVQMFPDQETPQQLENVLQEFGVKAKVIRVTRGPVITRYEVAPAAGVKISKIVNLADDIALALAARDVRIEAPIPGKAAVGIEVPNKQSRTVPFREVIETSTYKQNQSKLKVALGKDIADQTVIADLAKMPHLLVAGATGSGKSVCITALINSLLLNATPNEVKLLLVDPKMVELSQYNGIPHLLAPVVIDPKKASTALKWIVKEMETRYELFAAAGVRDIERYNKLKFEETGEKSPALPWIVVIIDELADLMLVAAGDVEEAICRLAQMARAAGIHLVIATQRPSVDVITGVIKANIPSRISFAVSSQIDSRTILDATGAEKLLGRGDMLYSPIGQHKPMRVQGCLINDDEVHRLIKYWQAQGRPDYLDPDKLFAETAKQEDAPGPDDELFVDAAELLITTGMASVSFLQRRLKLGYARAARLMDMLEEHGVVGGYEGSKPRQILLTLEEFRERFQ